MRKLLLLTLAVMVVILPAQAQTDYQLREPTAEDYVRFAAEGLTRCRWDPGESPARMPWSICAYLLPLIEENYADTLSDMPYELLRGAYDTLQPGIDWNAPGRPDLWHEALIQAWLRDNAVDLDRETALTFDDLRIQVEPRDFNADGMNEYVLDIYSPTFASLMVFARADAGTYTLVPGWFPYQLGDVPYWDQRASSLREIAFDDFNADGLPEWFLVYDGASYRGQYLGDMQLLAWRDGELRSLDDNAISYIPHFNTNAAELSDDSVQDGFIFTNLDDDPALEMQRIEITYDNWLCSESDIQVFDWNVEADRYVRTSFTMHQSDTANCVINDAEQALYDHRYSTAAHLYEYAITLPSEEYHYDDSAGFDTEMRQFIQLRLVQSYLLSQQYEPANNLLNTLTIEDMESEMNRNMLDVLNEQRNGIPEVVCTAVFNLFERAARDSFNYSIFQEKIGTRLTLGIPWDFHGDFLGAGNPVDPAFAGCNVPGLVEGHLQRDLYDYETNAPVEQLMSYGFLVHDYIKADFNGDGEGDWLIWHEANIPALLLMAQGVNNPLLQSYVPSLERPNEYVSWETVELPDTAGTAVVLFRSSAGFPSYYGGYRCDDGVDVLGAITFWQYAEDDTIPIYSTWCADRPTADDLFGVEAGEPVFYGRSDNQPQIYVWDTDVRRYVLPIAQATTQSIETTSVVGTAPATEEWSNEELYGLLGDGILDYYMRLSGQVGDAETIDTAIAILDAEINAPYVDNPFPLLFWKSRLLAQAGRSDELLAEYIVMYKTGPDLWSKFAELHLEPVAP